MNINIIQNDKELTVSVEGRLDTLTSPEQLTDYLHVTNPGI